jgi:hypothetical protein
MAETNADIKNFTEGLIGSLNRVTTGLAFKQSAEIIKANERMKESQERLARRQETHQGKVEAQQEKFDKSREKIMQKHANNQTQRDIELYKLDNRRNDATKELVDDFDKFKKSLSEGNDLEKDHIENLKSQGSMNTGIDGMSSGIDDMVKGIEGLTFGLVDLSGSSNKLTNFFKGIVSLGVGLISFLGSLGETVVLLTDHLKVFDRKIKITRTGGAPGTVPSGITGMGEDFVGPVNPNAATSSEDIIESSVVDFATPLGKKAGSFFKGIKDGIGGVLDTVSPQNIKKQFDVATKTFAKGASIVANVTPTESEERRPLQETLPGMEKSPQDKSAEFLSTYKSDSVPIEAAGAISDMLNGIKNSLRSSFSFGDTDKQAEAGEMMEENFSQMKGHAENFRGLVFGEGSMFAKITGGFGDALNFYGESVNKVGNTVIGFGKSVGQFFSSGENMKAGVASFAASSWSFLKSALKFVPAVLGFVVATTMFVGSMIVASLPFIAMGLLIAVGVALLVGAVVAVFNKFPIIGETLSTVFGFVFDTISGIVNVIMDVFSNIWGAITDIFGGFIDMFSAAFSGDFGGIFDGLMKIIGGVFDLFLAPFRAIFDGIAGFVNSLLPDWAKDMLGGDTASAEESGLYDKNRIGKSTVDASMISGAPTKDLMAIVSHNDLSEEDMALVKAELDSRNIGLEGTPMTGEELKEQREASKAAMDGGTQNNTAVAQQNTNNNVTNNAFSQSPNPRPTDSTIGRTAAVNLN